MVRTLLQIVSRPGQEQMPKNLNTQRQESGSLLAGSHSLPSCQGSNDCDLDLEGEEMVAWTTSVLGERRQAEGTEIYFRGILNRLH